MQQDNKITVYGLWHQGIVAAACLANKGYKVVGCDIDHKIVDHININKLQVEEPGLSELIKKNLKKGNLKFSKDLSKEAIDSDYIFISYDTPVSDQDEVSLDIIFDTINVIKNNIKKDTIIIVTSQLPAGTTYIIQKIIDNQNIVYIPENLQLGNAIYRFENPPLPVIGAEKDYAFQKVNNLLKPFAKSWERTNIITAEMLKHALNTFLSMSIVLANEIGDLCEAIGADGRDVGKFLKLENRIGRNALTRPGLAFAGGTLARDVVALLKIANKNFVKTKFIKSIWDSNNDRKSYLNNRVLKLLGNIKNKKALILGLTYKVDTNTLRRSASIELIKNLSDKGVEIYAYDPALTDEQILSLPEIINFDKEIHKISEKTDIIIIMTPWPVFKNIDFSEIKKQIIFDTPSMFDKSKFQNLDFDYYTIGTNFKSEN